MLQPLHSTFWLVQIFLASKIFGVALRPRLFSLSAPSILFFEPSPDNTSAFHFKIHHHHDIATVFDPNPVPGNLMITLCRRRLMRGFECPTVLQRLGSQDESGPRKFELSEQMDDGKYFMMFVKKQKFLIWSFYHVEAMSKSVDFLRVGKLCNPSKPYCNIDNISIDSFDDSYALRLQHSGKLARYVEVHIKSDRKIIERLTCEAKSSCNIFEFSKPAERVFYFEVAVYRTIFHQLFNSAQIVFRSKPYSEESSNSKRIPRGFYVDLVPSIGYINPNNENIPTSSSPTATAVSTTSSRQTESSALTSEQIANPNSPASMMNPSFQPPFFTYARGYRDDSSTDGQDSPERQNSSSDDDSDSYERKFDRILHGLGSLNLNHQQ